MTPFDIAQSLMRRALVARGVKASVSRVGGLDVHHYWARGTGYRTPLLLVHGLGGSANGFARVLNPLAKHFQSVHAFDFPGSGFSPVPERGPLGLDGHLEVLKAYVQNVIGEPTFVVGNSLGAAFCFQLAHDAPGSVKALALVSPAGGKVSEARQRALLETMKVGSVKEARAITRRLFHKPPLAALLLASELRRMYCTPTVLKLVAESGDRLFLAPELLAGLTVPILLLWGASEKLLPYEGVEHFRAHLPPTAQVEVVPGFGHVPQMEYPHRLVARLAAFAASQRL